MMDWKMIFLFNWVIFTFPVNLPGCRFANGRHLDVSFKGKGGTWNLSAQCAGIDIVDRAIGLGGRFGRASAVAKKWRLRLQYNPPL